MGPDLRVLGEGERRRSARGSLGALALLLVRRAAASPYLPAIRFVGVLIAVTLVAGVSLYSGAMGDAMLQQRIATDPSNVNLAVSLSGQALSDALYAALDGYIRHGESADLGMSLHDLRVHHNTAGLPVYRLGARDARPLTVSLALDYYDGLTDQVTVIAGTLDPPARLPGGDMPVVVSAYMARSLQVRTGDRLAFGPQGAGLIRPSMVVTGSFIPKDLAANFWDIHAGDAGYRSLIAPRIAAFQAFAARSDLFGPTYFWLQSAENPAVHLAAANAIVAGIARALSRVADLAPGTILITALNEVISGFLGEYSLLGSILLILVAPILAVILYGIAVTSALALDRQAAEIVLMRSRGATPAQVFVLYAGKGLVLGAIAVLLGPLIGLLLARLIGRASGFLTFNGGLPFAPALGPVTYLYGAITAVLCVLTGLLPALGLARRSMAAFKAAQARSRQRPLWQRLYLDAALLAVSLYGLRLLVQQGPVSSGDATAVVATDPLIAVAPLLFALAATLLLSRILPWVASLCIQVLGALSSPAAFVALQTVARAPRQPMRLVQLCTLTLTLGIFAATVAGVQARNLSDQYLYQAGATLRLHESYDRQGAPSGLRHTPDIMPLAAHLALPGVRVATPALRYESFGNVINMTDSGTAINILGIDPATAAAVMWYRPDFADQPLSRLLQTIEGTSMNAIVSASFLSATGLHQGDSFDVTLTNGARVALRVEALAHHFPSLDPSAFPFVVTSLAYLEGASGNYSPNEVWLDLPQNQGAIDRVLPLVHVWPRAVLSYEGLPPSDAAQGNPLSAGIYGVVSVGFLVAVVLALLSFLAYTYLTLQQRIAEVAILRALGLTQGQVRSLLLFEDVFLLGAAIAGGIVAGVLTTRLFLPYLPIAANVVPPFVVVMPWSAVGEFVLAVLVVFAVVLSIHVTLLLRVQLGQVLRLGDS